MPPSQVMHAFDPLPDQPGGRFFAADTPGAEHGDALAVKAGLVRLPPVGEVAEAVGARIDRAAERPDLDLVGVAGVDHRDVRRGNQRVPLGRGDIGAHALRRVGLGAAHRHDLALEPDLQPVEGHVRGLAFLPAQRLEPRQRPAGRPSPAPRPRPARRSCRSRPRAPEGSTLSPPPRRPAAPAACEVRPGRAGARNGRRRRQCTWGRSKRSGRAAARAG